MKGKLWTLHPANWWNMDVDGLDSVDVDEDELDEALLDVDGLDVLDVDADADDEDEDEFCPL